MTLLIVLLTASLRIGIVALVVALVLMLCRIRSGSLRHTAWIAVLCAMLLMPVLPYMVPAVQMPASVTPSMEIFPAVLQDVERVGTNTIQKEPATASLPQTPSPATPAPGWPALAIATYSLGISLLLWRFLAGWRSVQRIVRTSTRIPAYAAPIYESTLVSTPVTVGVWKQRVLLPPEWAAWPPEKLAAVLAHELAHVARHDTLSRLLAHLNCCIFWFHPLAWWLRRQIAVAAEQACDDAGVLAIGENRKYAQVLLDMAETVRRRGTRLSLQGVGVDGTGLLGHRIDRVLRGSPITKASRRQTVAVTIACAVAIIAVAACRNQYSVPLKPDPEETARAQRMRDMYSARGLKPHQVAALEAAVKTNPEDLESRNKLVLFYQYNRGNAAVLATHMLWLAKNHPEQDTAWIYVSSLNGPTVATMKDLWRGYAERANTPEPVLSNAAAFFEFAVWDPQTAEPILLDLQAKHPKTGWQRRLGALYGRALKNPNLPAAWVERIRRKLDESQDAELLASAGFQLLLGRQPPNIRPGSEDLARPYFERALKLDPNSKAAQQGLALSRTVDFGNRMRQQLGPGTLQERYKAVTALSEKERFEYLPLLAQQAYITAEMATNYKHDLVAARNNNLLARQWAEETLRMAPRMTSDPNYGTSVHRANMILGTLAMQMDGDRKTAVRYMLTASTVGQFPDSQDYFTTRLPTALLKYGGPDERKAVIQYLEAYGKLAGSSNPSLLADADKLRHGYMPVWYQYQSAKFK